MDVPKLIAIVQEYEELYNYNHHNYSNQQRRDKIWEEIGERLDTSGIECKERWTRIRDNHRRALSLRKTKSSLGSSKLKPAKFARELAFLVPYMNDNDDRRSSVSSSRSVNIKDEPQVLSAMSDSSIQDVSEPASPPPIEFASTRSVGRESSFKASQVPQDQTVAELLDYLTKTEQNRHQNDPLVDFFVNMAKTVKTFPLQDQIQIKAQLFQMVNNVEMRLAVADVNTVYESLEQIPNKRESE